jgi:hypothetical protein
VNDIYPWLKTYDIIDRYQLSEIIW